MYSMTDAEFEEAIQAALDRIPDQFLDELENVAIVMEDEPNEYHLGEVGIDDDYYADDYDDSDDFDDEDFEDYGDGDEDFDDGELMDDDYEAGDFDDEPYGSDNTSSRHEVFSRNGELLGLFDGASILEQDFFYGEELPNVITIFKGPHERSFDTREEVVEEVAKTVIHEIGHYFGMDEQQLKAMGYE